MAIEGFHEVASDVYLADGALPETPVINLKTVPDLTPPKYILDSIRVSGNFFMLPDFERAGVDAGKTANYGAGVMRDLATEMVGLEADEAYSVNGRGVYLRRGTPGYETVSDIRSIMNNPDLVRKGSRNRLLIGADLVYDVWRAGEGHTLPYDVPTYGKVGHKIISMLMLFRPDFVELKLLQEPDKSD